MKFVYIIKKVVVIYAAVTILYTINTAEGNSLPPTVDNNIKHQ